MIPVHPAERVDPGQQQRRGPGHVSPGGFRAGLCGQDVGPARGPWHGRERGKHGGIRERRGQRQLGGLGDAEDHSQPLKRQSGLASRCEQLRLELAGLDLGQQDVGTGNQPLSLERAGQPDMASRRVPAGLERRDLLPGEDPAEAAARELVEETGYRAARVRRLGSLNPNPALFGNRVHSFVAEGVTRACEIANGPLEETVVELVPVREVRERLRRGEIDHALVVAALQWWLLEAEPPR